MGKNTVREECA